MKKCFAMVMALGLSLLVCTGALAANPNHLTHTSNCLVCRIIDMIEALPDAVTLENATAATEQVHAIDRIKFDLTDAEYEDGVDDVVDKYHNTVKAINELGGGGWLLAAKSIMVDGLPASMNDLSAAQVQFALEKQGDPSWTPQTLTLSTLEMQTQMALGMEMPALFSTEPVGYEDGTSGWIYKYQLPAGTYTLTEITGLPAVIDGQEMYTSSVAVNGKPGNVATFSIEDGKETSVAFWNTYASYSVSHFSVQGGVYDRTKETITLTEGKPFSITAEIDDTFEVKWEWQLLKEADSFSPEDVSNDDSYQGTANPAMDQMYLKAIAHNGRQSAEKVVQLIVVEKSDVHAAGGAGSSSPSVPQTGDATPLALLVSMAALSLMGLCLLNRRRSA